MKSKVFADLAWIQISDFLGIGKLKHSRDKKVIGKTFFFCLAYLAVAAIFICYGFLFGKLYIDQGLADLALPFLFTIASIAVLWTSLLKSNSYLIGAKDYEMLQSLPISTGSVVSCRLLVSYCLECLFGAALLLPTGFYYGITFDQDIFYYVILIVDTLFLPVFPIIVATILGVIVTAVSSRFRHKNIIMIFLSMALLIGVLLLSFSAPEIDSQEFLSINDQFLSIIFQIYPLSRFFSEGLCSGIASSTIFYLGISLLCLVLFYFVMQKTYQFLNTALLAHSVRADYKITSMKSHSLSHALFQKEWKRYCSSPVYVLNTIAGYLLMVLLGGFLCFSGPDALQSLMPIPEISDLVVSALPFVLGLCGSMGCSTAASISIEGKNLWQTVALPVKSSKIYNSKRAVSLIVAVPASILSSVLVFLAIPMELTAAVFLFVIPLLYVWFSAELGLFLNLLFPKFDWKNETAIVKQGLPMFIVVFGGMALGILPIILMNIVPETFQDFVSPAVVILLLIAACILHCAANKIELISVAE